MNCPTCGAPCADGVKFCTKCGTPMAQQAAPVAEPVAAPVAEPVAAPVAEPVAAPVAAPAAEAPAAKAKSDNVSANSVVNEVKKAAKPVMSKLKPFLRNKFVLLGAAALVVLLIALCVVSIVKGQDNGFIKSKATIRVVANEGELTVIVNNKALKETIDGDDYYMQRSLDGKVAAIIAYEESDDDEPSRDLYVVKGKKIIKVADDVYSYEMSVSGKGLAYSQIEDEEEETYSLFLYNIGTKKAKEITSDMCNNDFAISPNGKSVAYYEAGDEDEPAELYYAKGTKSQKITSKETDLVGLSDNGKYIYAICTDKKEVNSDYYDYSDYLDYDYSYDLCKFNKKGERVKLGEITPGYYYTTATFNADHTQVMFYNDGKTYISTKGKDAVKVSSGMLELVEPRNSGYFYDTAPVDDLYNHVYISETDSGSSAWLIKKNTNKSVKLASKVSRAMLDESAKYLYYLRDGDELRTLKISHGARAAEKSKLLAEDVDNYVVTSNRKRVYFVSDEGLYSINGKRGGKVKTVASDDVAYSLGINGKDVVFYEMDGDVYACSNGKTGKLAMSDAEIDYSTSNGLVFIESDDALYVNKSGKKFKQIAEIENEE